MIMIYEEKVKEILIRVENQCSTFGSIKDKDYEMNNIVKLMKKAEEKGKRETIEKMLELCNKKYLGMNRSIIDGIRLMKKESERL